MDPRDQLKTLRRLRELKKERGYRAARTDFFAFQETVMKDEQGDYWVPGKHHRRWDKASKQARSIIFSPIEHGKTEQRTIARTLWEIGVSNGSIRNAIISEAQSQSKKMLGVIKHYIDIDEDYQRVFPGIKRGKPWGEAAIKVKGYERQKDFTVQALGVNGSFLGARIDRAVLDDILSFLNTLQEQQREKTLQWILSTLIGRITPYKDHGLYRTGLVELIGTAWHRQDAMHELEKRRSYFVIRDKACELATVKGQTRATKILWGVQWPEQRLLERLDEIGELEFSRQMMNIALSDALARFSQRDIDAAFALAVTLGHQIYGPHDRYEGGLPTFTGVDLGVGQKKRSDLSSLVTHAKHPNGLNQVLSVRSGRWDMSQIIFEIKTEFNRFGSIVNVESNAAQDYIRQHLLDTTDVRVRQHITTAANKLDQAFGVESLSVELRNRKWSIPRAGETEQMVREALYYDPVSHAGDRLMAWWISREAGRLYSGRSGKVRSGKRLQMAGAAIYNMDF